MASETTILLRRAVAMRHTPDARRFWMTVLDALIAGTADPEVCFRVLSDALTSDPAASSIGEWLSALTRAGTIDTSAVMAHTNAVSGALERLRPLGGATESPRRATVRVRIRAALGRAGPPSRVVA